MGQLMRLRIKVCVVLGCVEVRHRVALTSYAAGQVYSGKNRQLLAPDGLRQNGRVLQTVPSSGRRGLTFIVTSAT